MQMAEAPRRAYSECKGPGVGGTEPACLRSSRDWKCHDPPKAWAWQGPLAQAAESKCGCIEGVAVKLREQAGDRGRSGPEVTRT